MLCCDIAGSFRFVCKRATELPCRCLCFRRKYRYSNTAPEEEPKVRASVDCTCFRLHVGHTGGGEVCLQYNTIAGKLLGGWGVLKIRPVPREFFLRVGRCCLSPLVNELHVAKHGRNEFCANTASCFLSLPAGGVVFDILGGTGRGLRPTWGSPWRGQGLEQVL